MILSPPVIEARDEGMMDGDPRIERGRELARPVARRDGLHGDGATLDAKVDPPVLQGETIAARLSSDAPVGVRCRTVRQRSLDGSDDVQAVRIAEPFRLL